MRRISIYFTFTLLFLGGMFTHLISNSNGPASGHAGEPGGLTCRTCHNSFPLNGGSGSVGITTNIPPEGYTPGQTYTITTQISEQGINTFGFQATIFGDNANMGVGSLMATDPSQTRVSNAPLADYITHTITGNQGQGQLSWSFAWTAPPAGELSATIYAAFVAGNGQDGNKGDEVYTTSLQVQEAPPQTGTIKAFLSGYYNPNQGSMTNELRNLGLIPAAQPFGGAPFNYRGSETLQTQRADITDWVLLEVREDQAPQNVVARKAVLISQAGQLLNSAGSPNILFPILSRGNYYLAIRHKSHLGVISRVPISIDPSVPISYDYTTSVNQALGTNQLQPLGNGGNIVGLFPGDFDNNGVINNLDFNMWKQNGAVVNSYLPIDADGNGIVNNQDFNKWAGNPSKVGSPDL